VIDDDRMIDVVGVVVAVFVVLAVAVLVLAGATAPSRQPAEPPAANWTIERVDVGTVNVTHAGGEPVDAGELVVSVAGVERSPGRSDVLTEGEALTVPARSGHRVQLFWVESRDERTLLAEWRAP
jgi:hypothetical protein